MAASPPRLLIAGPTASGKSALALKLARAVGGEIVNADSIQLYAELTVLSARPSADEMALAPHHLYGVASAGETWSVGRWLRAATAVLADIAARGRPAIVVGGTGLYFNALTRGLADIPPTPARVRAATLTLYEAEGEAAFRERLAAVDPAAEARIAPRDSLRLTRALEVHAATGRSITDWRARTRPILAPDGYEAVVLEPAREALFARCDERLAAMFAAGAVEEAARLLAMDLPASAPAMRALGVAPLRAHLCGEIELATALTLAQRDTRRYAKRQLTWLRHQMPEWPRIGGKDDATWLAQAISGFRNAPSSPPGPWPSGD